MNNSKLHLPTLIRYVQEFQDVLIIRTEFEIVYHGSPPDYNYEELTLISSKAAHYLERQKTLNVTWPIYKFDKNTSSIMALSFSGVANLRLELPLHWWLGAWSNLQPQLVAEHNLPLEFSPIFQELHNIVAALAISNGIHVALSLIEELWAWRCMRDCQCAGLLRYYANIAVGKDYVVEAKEAFDHLIQNLDDLRKKSQSMDDWLEGLFLLAPLIEEARFANKSVSDSECEKRLRMIEEFSVDKGTLESKLIGLGVCSSDAVLEELLPKPYPQPDEIRSYRRHIIYESESRVSFPRYLVEAICRHFEQGARQNFPPNIAIFNYRHLIANNFVSRWGMHEWI